MIAGELIPATGSIELAPGRARRALVVTNSGDRPIQIGSHFHFADVNDALLFERAKARGFRLDIPAGTSVRFEPGFELEVTLVELAGARAIPGLRVRATE